MAPKNSIASTVVKFREEVHKRLRDLAPIHPRKLKTPRQVAEVWSEHMHALLQLVEDPVVANRGTWKDAKYLNNLIEAEDRRVLGGVIRSAAVRGIGARLERGLQFHLHIPFGEAKDFVTREITALLEDSERGEYDEEAHDGAGDPRPESGLIDDDLHRPPALSPDLRQSLEEVRSIVTGAHNEARDLLQVFTELWQYVYSHFNEKDVTLGNQLLRERGLEDGAVVYSLDTGSVRYGEAEFPDYSSLDSAQLDGYRWFPLLTNAGADCCKTIELRRLRRRVVCTVLAALVDIWHQPHLREYCEAKHQYQANEVIRHFGQRALAAICRQGGGECTATPRDPWFGVPEALEQLEYYAASALTEQESDLWLANNRSVEKATAAERWKRKLQWIHLVQQFLLYHGGQGRYFYFVINPPFLRTTLRSTFSLGTHRPLDPEELEAVLRLHQTVVQALSDRLSQSEEVKFKRGFATLPSILGRDVCAALTERVCNMVGWKEEPETVLWDVDPTLGGLPLHLLFAEALAAQASHEGKALRFDLLVADGVRRYETVETISSFVREDGRPTQYVVEMQEAVYGADGYPKPVHPLRVNLALVGRVLGNFAFLQPPEALLLGGRAGRLLAIGRNLAGPVDPEFLTRAPAPVPEGHPSQQGCYLIRVLESGEIQVFHRGELILWRRLGRYFVVSNTEYGVSYRHSLAERIAEFVNVNGGSAPVPRIFDPEVLASVVWEVSQTRGQGACFVLGRKWQETMGERVRGLGKVFQHAHELPLVWRGGREVLRDLAIQDGATVIDIDTGAVFGRQNLRPQTRVLDEDTFESIARDHPEVHYWGTRHYSSLEFALEHKDTTVGAEAALLLITVSSDGDIHVFEPDTAATPGAPDGPEALIVKELTYPPRP